MNIKLILVEDEEPAMALLMNYLSHEPDVDVLGQYTDGFSGARAINQLKPDLVLLDIQLPRLNGFELLELLDYNPIVIFTTAYDEYALKAFEQNATDYLLKPFSQERFAKAIAKVRLALGQRGIQPDKSVADLASNLTQAMPLNRVVVKDSKGIQVIPMPDILYIEAQDDYVMIYTTTGRHLKKQTLKHYEQRLNGDQFVRVHRSYIVNVLQVKKIEPYERDSYIAFLVNGAKIRVSTQGYKRLREVLDF